MKFKLWFYFDLVTDNFSLTISNSKFTKNSFSSHNKLLESFMNSKEA